MPTAGEALDAAEAALYAAMCDSPTMAGVAMSRGWPINMRDETAWLNYADSATRKPEASNLTLGENTAVIGGGASVAQFAGEDRQPIADRLLELSNAIEAIIAPNLGGDPTLSHTCMQAWLSKYERVETLDDAQKPRLLWLFEITLVFYA